MRDWVCVGVYVFICEIIFVIVCVCVVIYKCTNAFVSEFVLKRVMRVCKCIGFKICTCTRLCKYKCVYIFVGEHENVYFFCTCVFREIVSV